MKPVSNWDQVGRGYHFKEKTWYSNYHLGLDLMTPSWTPLVAPFDGTSVRANFAEGGNVINYSANGYVFRFMHLAQISKTGQCKAGDLIGYTGNSGTLTTGAHLHVDISKGSVQVNNINNFLDPETFAWGEGVQMADEIWTYINQHRDRLYLLEQADINIQNQLKAINANIANLTKALGENNAIDAVQATQLVKALKDSQDALNRPQGGSTLTTEQLDSLSKWQGIVTAFKNLLK